MTNHKPKTHLPFIKYYVSKTNGLVYLGVGKHITHFLTSYNPTPISAEYNLNEPETKKLFRKLPRAVGWHIEFQCQEYKHHLKHFREE